MWLDRKPIRHLGKESPAISTVFSPGPLASDPASESVSVDAPAKKAKGKRRAGLSSVETTYEEDANRDAEVPVGVGGAGARKGLPLALVVVVGTHPLLLAFEPEFACFSPYNAFLSRLTRCEETGHPGEGLKSASCSFQFRKAFPTSHWDEGYFLTVATAIRARTKVTFSSGAKVFSESIPRVSLNFPQ